MADNKWITLDNGTHIPIEKGQTKGEAIDTFVYRKRAEMRSISVGNDHYSRLRRMFSDYHLGTCKPRVYENVKLFELDRTMYIVVGEYPDMVVIGKKTYKTHDKFYDEWEE